MKAERLPDREDFIKYYNALLDLAGVVDRSYPVKGTYVWMPYGLSMMRKLIGRLDSLFQSHGIEEVAFPLLVPVEFALQNDKWFNSFREEAFYLADKDLILRPTGEPAMYPIFRLWIKRGMLPIRVYETVTSFRNEGRTTHTLIRDREICYWHEIHTVHRTREEAVAEAMLHKSFYDFVWKELLDIPPICVSKPPYEVFAGSDSAFEFYSIMPDGRLIENGSVNNLGQAYAKKFDVAYVDGEGKKEYAWQVCTGNGARFIAAVIAVHGDDRGLVLPPAIAPVSAVIIPIGRSDTKAAVEKAAQALGKKLADAGIAVKLDDSDKTPGEKFNIWELKGVPLRIELGMKEVEGRKCTVARRDTGEKVSVPEDDVVETVKKLLDREMPDALMASAKALYSKKIKHLTTVADATDWIAKNGVAKANWCESEECFDRIAEIAPSVEAIGTLTDEEAEGKCIVCGKETRKLTLFGRTY